MPSPQSKLVSLALRRLVKRRCHRLELDVDYARTWVNLMAGLPWPRLGTRVESLRVGSLQGEWLHPAQPGPGVILYLHGGGYFFCSPVTHRPVTAALASAARTRVLALRYRLAPEHPFPAALEDAVAAYRYLLAQGYAAHQIALAGDSAGGGLSLATMVWLRDHGLPLPAAAACFSPWTDLAGTGASMDTNDAHCAMFSADALRRAGRIYLGPADPYSPLASPLYADLSGLPPLLVHVSDTEVLLDDSTRLVARAREQKVPVELRVWNDQPHVWQLFSRVLPEGRSSLAEAAAFLRSRIEPGGSQLLPFMWP